MKYERQQHSQLFIALQERKKKRWREQPHHIHSGAELVLLFFFTHKEGILQRACHHSSARESPAIWKRTPHPQIEA